MTIALLLATAEERQLPPLTSVLPNVLLPVVERPVMATAVELLARAGIKRILIALHEQTAPITAAFGSGRRWGVEIEYITLPEAWADGGALRWAGPLVHETCLVLPGLRLSTCRLKRRWPSTNATARLLPPSATRHAISSPVCVRT